MKKIIPLFIIIAIFICGCQQQDVQETTLPPTETTAVPETEETQTALDMESGAYQGAVENEITKAIVEYFLFIPEKATEDMPLVIFLHGDGEVGRVKDLKENTMITKAKLIYGEDFPFIGLAPCSYIDSWSEGGVPELVMELIEQVAKECKIDRERIILTGYSRGAAGVCTLISRYGDFFSAAVAISCPSIQIDDINECAEVPIWMFAGNYDEMEFAYQTIAQKFVDQVNEAGGDASFYILPGCTHNDTDDTAFGVATFHWILQH